MKVLWVVLLLGVAEVTHSLSWTLSWAEDPSGSWTWDEAWSASPSFTPTSQPRLAFGYTPRAHWFRLDWHREAGDGRLFFLLAYTQMDEFDLQFRTTERGRLWKLGDTSPAERDTPRFIFPVVPWPEEDEGTLLVRLRSSNSPTFDPVAITGEDFETLQRLEPMGIGFYLGFLVLMILFNLFMVATTRESLYWWYSGYLVAMILFSLLYSGTLQTWFPNARPFHNVWDVPSIALLAIAAQAFAYRMNGFQIFAPAPWLAGLVYLGVGTAVVVHLLGWHILALQTINTTMLLMVLWIWILAFLLALRGREQSRFFLVAWTLLLFSGWTMAASSLGLPTFGIALTGGFLIGSSAVLVETIVLSAALAHRFRLLQQEADRHREKAALTDRLTTLGLLTARVGHEINTPNHVVMLNTSLLSELHQDLAHAVERAREDDVTPGKDWDRALEEMAEQIHSIRSAAGQIGKVVAGLAVRPQHSPPTLCDLGKLAHDTCRLYDSRWRERCSRLIVNTESGAVVWGVEFRLQQLIVNLVNNAVQALTARDQAVSLKVETKEREVVLTVTDEGRGMDETTVARLGTPFFTTKEDRGGTGLGWGICRDILREHQAQLDVKSRLGAGTTVMVRLALAEPV